MEIMQESVKIEDSMANTGKKNQPTEDDIKHVEFLYADLKDFRDVQDRHYKDLVTKATFLSGFIVTVLALYGTYASHVNSALKIVTLITLGVALLVLCGAFTNRKFYQAEMSDVDVDASDYFDKVYQAVANIKRACDDNEDPLKSVAHWIRWGVRILVVGILFLISSFCFSSNGVIQLRHHDYSWASERQTSKATGEVTSTTY